MAITIAQAMRLIDELVNNPFDGSINAVNYMISKIKVVNALKSLASDQDEIYGLFLLYGFHQPKLAQHLSDFPISLQPNNIAQKLPSLFAATDLALEGKKSSLSVSRTASVCT